MSASFLPLPRTAGGGEDFSGKQSDGEQAGQQGHQHHANDGDARAGHELLHALAFRAGVVVAVTFQQVDDAPYAETGTEGDNEGLENGDCLIENSINKVGRNQFEKFDLVMVHRHTKAGQSAAQFPGWLIPAFLLFHYF